MEEMIYMSKVNDLRKVFEDGLPAVLYRNNPRFKELTGISPRSMANLDSQGNGPAGRIYVGRVSGYPRECLVDWMLQRVRIVREELQ